MLNHIVLFGKVKEEPILIKDKNENDLINLEVEIPKRNKEDESDLVIVKLTNGIAKNAVEYLHIGDTVGIKGIVKVNENREMEIIAEKVTFLSSSKKNEDNENETGILER